MEGASEDEGSDGHEFYQDVDRGATRVLQRVAYGVADDSGLVGGSAFGLDLALDLESTGFDELLCVVPRAARVRETDGNLHTTHDCPGEETAYTARAD